MDKIILATSSPRRIKLFEQSGLSFVVDKSPYKENLNLKYSPEKLAKVLALGKAMAVVKKRKSGIVVSGDTVVVLGGKVLGKPKNKKEAVGMLKMLSAKTHRVITGYCVVNVATKKIVSGHTMSKITFRKLSEEEIVDYVNNASVLDKAGAYAIQELAGGFVKKIDGDVLTIIGMPMKEIIKVLKSM